MPINNSRHFAIKDDNGKTKGRFSGVTPKQAARKAFTTIYKNGECALNQTFKFKIQEITQGSKRREFVYDGVREKLDTPSKYIIKTQSSIETITINYVNKIYKHKV